MHRLENASQCNDIGFPDCDNSTCYNSNFTNCVENECFSSHVICTSHCDDKHKCSGIFQCNDNGLILFSQFCDGIVDCADGSDEIENQPGFKCNKCVLPQNNLYDNIAHCEDSSDLCLRNSSVCFQCYDKRLLISSEQVCNGVRDCYDLSDECLCEKYFDTEECVDILDTKMFQCFDNTNITKWHNPLNMSHNISGLSTNPFVKCNTKYNSSIYAVVCDGRPECKNYEDECKCRNSLEICNDFCHDLYPMGDRYCDGVEDPAWKIINDSACPQGFDEMFCPKRFKCGAHGKVSIDVLQVCDGTAHCDDGSDEKDCPGAPRFQSVFSSDSEMIAAPAIKAAFWIVGLVVISGNSYVIITTIIYLKNKKIIDSTAFQRIIILNISIADYIMGIYLLTIASYSAFFSGNYGEVDREWRSSLKCSLVGSLVTVSSQSSVFLMVVLTAFRLKNVTNAFGSLTASMRPWIFGLVASWLFAFFLSLIPMLNITSPYFIGSFSISSLFHNGTWKAAKLPQFACRFAALSNMRIPILENKFQSLLGFVKNSLHNNTYVAFFGYYSQTSICMPRFYVAYKESSWEYAIFIITLNFLCFCFIAISYIVIFGHSTQSSINTHKCLHKSSNKHAAKMQKRIARIIATDFCCWIPICVMAYVRLAVKFSDIVYQISAVLLLPINSALNPFLFTSLPDKLISMCLQKYKK